MSKSIKIALIAVVIAAGGALTYAYRDSIEIRVRYVLDLGPANSTSGDDGVKPAAMQVPKVPVAEVVTRNVAPSSLFTGHLEASKTTELRARVGGVIDAVSVPEGGLVQEGQLLFEIYPRPFQVALDATQSQLQQATVLLAQAESDYRRAEALAPKGTVSRKTYDDAQAAVRERQAQVDIARAAVAAADLDLSYTQVTAPISGRVDRTLLTEGNLVTGGNGGAATLLTTIVSNDPLHVYFDIDEVTYLKFIDSARASDPGAAVKPLPVKLGLMTDVTLPHAGELDFIGNRIDRSSGTIRARATLRNTGGQLTPGLFARVELTTADVAETVLVDDQAIGVDQGRRFTLVLGSENKAEYRSVEIGPMIDGLRVVSGVNPGEKIIVKGLVRPGMEVDPIIVPMMPSDRKEGDRLEARR
ncbi:efflux RND transporter periplasmic adaptor subunit [Brucella tritici]|uniref:Efflux RND transporter periplasmic adaptor subunit n=1 Tax=Brucella tritici TaxID=94626 RepID=A0A6L3YMU2_9HYPH|nr:efflux RND transporter periplasmic adaptor subunit [Brucella tritici]KAB2684383.1 efflux RND transporter periplasmic adaptor subunit [Brucella tritici]